MCVDFIEWSFEVKSGDTFSSTLSKIYPQTLLTKIYLKRNPPEFGLQAGRYNIPCANVSWIIESLREPIKDLWTPLTLLEGWNVFDIDIYLTQQWLIESQDFVNYTTNKENYSGLIQDYPFLSDALTLEGFLYPDTYLINTNTFSVESLVKKMLNNFHVKIFDSNIIDIDTKSSEIIKTLNLASIVQKEANKLDNPQEISIIAGILKKRLNEGWQIGADATVCYAHDIATQDCTPVEVVKYLYETNQYNTRVITGLPIWPIANPEDIVIKATVNYKTTPYYYYLHDNFGKIHYGITNNDHLKNKQLYLK